MFGTDFGDSEAMIRPAASEMEGFFLGFSRMDCCEEVSRLEKSVMLFGRDMAAGCLLLLCEEGVIVMEDGVWKVHVIWE